MFLSTEGLKKGVSIVCFLKNQSGDVWRWIGDGDRIEAGSSVGGCCSCTAKTGRRLEQVGSQQTLPMDREGDREEEADLARA